MTIEIAIVSLGKDAERLGEVQTLFEPVYTDYGPPDAAGLIPPELG